MGVNFDIASNGKEALNMFKNNKYDIVFMDINMPIMDGIEAFKQIREHESEIADQGSVTYVPIIALTANAIKGDKEKFLTLGMNDYLSKPIEMEKLKVVFDKYLIKNEIKQEHIVEVKEAEKIKTVEATIEETQTIEETVLQDIQSVVVLDPKQIADKLGVSENIGKILISKFKSEIPKDLQELENHIQAADFKMIKDKAHYIKNSCLNLGLEEICKDIQQIETEIKDINELKKKFVTLKKMILQIS